MDIYQKVIVKIFETTGGRESQIIDLKDLVKKLGFIGHYASIFERLSGEGWVAETNKADFVRITHWGVAEAKKAQAVNGADQNSEAAMNQEALRCATLAREFAALIESFAGNASKENLSKAQAKFEEVEIALNQAKTVVR